MTRSFSPRATPAMPPDSKLLAAGVRHYRARDFEQAHKIYSQLLADNPQDPVILDLLGAVCIKLGQLPEAGVHLAEAVRLDPALGAAHDNLGLLLTAQNRFAEAAVSFRRAAALDPRNTQSQLNLANALLRAAQISAAIEAYRHAVQMAPDNVAGHSELAKLLSEQGRAAEAVPHWRHVTRLKPDDARAHCDLGDALARTGHPTESLAAYQAAIRLKPDSIEACTKLAGLYFEQKLFDAAARWWRRAIELQPGFAEAYLNLGCALMKLKKHQEAIEALQTAISLKPRMSEAYLNLGVAFAAEGKSDEALAHYRRALALRPEDPVALYNVGNVFLKLGDVEAALDHYDRAIELNPAYAEARNARSAVWLLRGKLAEGFAEYEWRFRMQDHEPQRTQWKPWNGEVLAGRTIVLCGEGGWGDTLQFVRYAPLLKEQGARVLVARIGALSSILARTPGVDGFVMPGMVPVEADFCVPMMSLPHRMHTTLVTIPAEIPYIFADEQLCESWRQKLSASEGFKVGIVWQGNPKTLHDRSRSIALSHYAALARIPGVRLISLQQGPGVEQLRNVARSWPIVELGDEIDKAAGAFMDTAAIMKNLDLVITSDTAAAHLAGALGVKVWVALQMVPEWRWMLAREDSPWYPTMRLFRQTRLGDWPEVFGRIAGALERLVARGGGAS